MSPVSTPISPKMFTWLEDGSKMTESEKYEELFPIAKSLFRNQPFFEHTHPETAKIDPWEGSHIQYFEQRYWTQAPLTQFAETFAGFDINHSDTLEHEEIVKFFESVCHVKLTETDHILTIQTTAGNVVKLDLKSFHFRDPKEKLLEKEDLYRIIFALATLPEAAFKKINQYGLETNEVIGHFYEFTFSTMVPHDLILPGIYDYEHDHLDADTLYFIPPFYHDHPKKFAAKNNLPWTPLGYFQDKRTTTKSKS